MVLRQITKPNLSDGEKPVLSLKDEIKEALDLDEDSVLDVVYDEEVERLIIEEVTEEEIFMELENRSEQFVEEEI